MNRKGKSPGRASKGAKTPKAKPGGDNATDRGVDQATKKTTTENVETDDVASGRAIATRSTTHHVDDDNYELDITTGKFIKKKKKLVVCDDDDADDIEMEEIDDEERTKTTIQIKMPTRGMMMNKKSKRKMVMKISPYHP